VNERPRGTTTTCELRSNDPHSIVRPYTTAPSAAFRVMPVQAVAAPDAAMEKSVMTDATRREPRCRMGSVTVLE
jgi:hypothetical protein